MTADLLTGVIAGGLGGLFGVRALELTRPLTVLSRFPPEWRGLRSLHYRGRIVIDMTLPDDIVRQAVRHETVHWLRGQAPLATVTTWLNRNSQLWKLLEEAAARLIGSGSAVPSLSAPLHEPFYRISLWRVALEAAASGGAAHLAHHEVRTLTSPAER
jgi:hypothetical protein